MEKPFFVFEDGDFGFSISDNMAMDFGVNTMMHISDNMTMDLNSGGIIKKR